MTAIARKAWRLPWQGEWVPHGLLDVLRGCNISCRACYNTLAPRIKPLVQVEAEFQVLLKHRRIDSISLVGGEPTLHPDLGAIIRMIKAAGVSVELFTNGLHAEPAQLAALRTAGVDMVFLHIDAHQSRPDLPQVTPASLLALRREKAAAISAAGMEVGLAITAYPSALDQIDAACELVLNSPQIDYLLVTLCRDTVALGSLRGDLSAGIQSASPSPCLANPPSSSEPLSMALVEDRLRQRFGLQPFAFLGSNVDPDDPRWVSYLAGSVANATGRAFWRNLRPSAIEPLFSRLFRHLKGRYPFFLRRAPAKFRLQLLLNALTGGAIAGNLALFARSIGAPLRTKRLLLQCPAELDPSGRLIHCAECPDATVRGSELVPVCIADQIHAAAEPLTLKGVACRSPSM